MLRLAPTVTQEAENIQTLLALVAAGLGVAFVPQSVMEGSPRLGVVFRPLPPPPAITSAIAWPTERNNAAADAFRRIVMDASAKLSGIEPKLSKRPGRRARSPIVAAGTNGSWRRLHPVTRVAARASGASSKAEPGPTRQREAGRP